MAMKLVVVIPHRQFDEFLAKKRLEAVDTLPNLHPRARKAIRDFIYKHTSYNKEPIACLSRFRGAPSSNISVGIDVRNVLTTSPGSTLWELRVPEDMVVSIPYERLMNLSYEMDQETSEGMLSLLEEDLMDDLTLGELDGDDVISFIPFIVLDKCLKVSKIDSFWGVKELNVPGVENVPLHGISVFNSRRI